MKKIFILREVSLEDNNQTKDIRIVAYCESPKAVWNYLTLDGQDDCEVSIIGHENKEKAYLIKNFVSDVIIIKVHKPEYYNYLLNTTVDECDKYYTVTPVEIFKTFFDEE